MTLGDAVEPPEVDAVARDARAVARPSPPPQRRFICRGCYFIYEEAQGLPRRRSRRERRSPTFRRAGAARIAEPTRRISAPMSRRRRAGARLTPRSVSAESHFLASDAALRLKRRAARAHAGAVARARAAPPGAVGMRPPLLLASLLIAGSSLPALADDGATRIGAAAYGDWRSDAPGVRRLITPADLPAPVATRSAANLSRARRARRRRNAEGAAGLRGRSCSPAASTSRASFASRRTATSSSPRAERAASASSAPPTARRKSASAEVFADGLASPVRDRLLPAGPGAAITSMSRRPTRSCAFPTAAARRRPPGRPRSIAHRCRRRRGHWTRDLAFSPDGKTLFVSVGSGLQRRRRNARRAGEELAAFAATPRSARPGARRRTAPTCSPSIPTAAPCASSRPAFAIARALRSQPQPARSGARSTSATGSATTCRPTT